MEPHLHSSSLAVALTTCPGLEWWAQLCLVGETAKSSGSQAGVGPGRTFSGWGETLPGSILFLSEAVLQCNTSLAGSEAWAHSL